MRARRAARSGCDALGTLCAAIPYEESPDDEECSCTAPGARAESGLRLLPALLSWSF